MSWRPIIADGSPEWLPLVLTPAALVGWVVVVSFLFRLAALVEGIFWSRGGPERGPRPTPSRTTASAEATTTAPPSPPRPPVPAAECLPPSGNRPLWGKQADRKKKKDWPADGIHLYSAGGVDRGHVIALIGLVGALGAVVAVLQFPSWDPELAGFVGAGLGCSLSLPLVSLYDRWAWRWSALGLPRLSKIPDLVGEWEGWIDVQQGVEGEKTPEKYLCRVCIRQTWSRISIEFITEATESWSVMTTLNQRRLHYEYFVLPRPDPPPGSSLSDAKPHYGMVRLTPHPPPSRRSPCNELHGHWFNDRDWLRWGEIRLSRVGRCRRP
jgi:hypothetical protein